ncbi:MAG: UDP-N-acetylglucosamine 1-carboxyvinyltransferase [Defluviitaleaceae bacterium]|nr:UDP-N-acetylglucosamine 1-carboxyvinyltransferase [Defluviitaleaceae bacterium]
MEYLVINGGKRLQGEVTAQGAKNAAVGVISAAVLANDICIVDNLPNIEDITNLIAAMNDLGIKCRFIDEHCLEIDPRNIKNHIATGPSVTKIRASYYLIGVLLGKYRKAEVAMPGGCNFGNRPIDQHIKGFKALGAEVFVENGLVKAYAEDLTGTSIYLDVVSVGATINIMLAAALADGTTIIENAAKEPHVVDTANMLNMMGAKIKGAGTDVIRIKGVKELKGVEYTIIPDQIEAGTYMIAAAATGGDVTVKNIIPRHMDSLTAKLCEMDCSVMAGDDYIRVIGPEKLKATNIKTRAYPGFPTDLQPQMTALLSTAEGTSFITENIWESRFQYVDELKRLGCNITVEGKAAVVEGGGRLTGAEASATDLRAGASLIIAALAAEGRTLIGNVRFIDRGYEDIVGKLAALGADCMRVDSKEQAKKVKFMRELG